MKIELFDVKEFIDANNLKEITSPILFQRGNVPDPNGLISNEIFGIDVKSRRTTFAYIDLKGHFFHPHIYKAFKRLFRNIEKIVNGSEYYSIQNDGTLVKDENGETGLDFIYDNWEKIRWEKSLDENSIRNQRIELLTKTPKNQIFMQYQIVIPAFYRDINPNQSGGGETDEINNLYSKQIRYASMLEDRGMFDFTYHSINYNMQSIIIEIYDLFKRKLTKKNGMIRKFLMGKNIDYCTRSVISNPIYNANRPGELGVSFMYAGVPLSQVCSLCYTFMMSWLKNFFEREYIQNKNSKYVYDPKNKDKVEVIEIVRPETYFTDDYIKKLIDKYIEDPECRFDPIQVPTTKGMKNLSFIGKRIDPTNHSELSTISDRPMTVTDLLYIAAYDIVKDKHIMCTRYPVSDSYGMFFGRIHVLSTLKTEVVKINNTIYDFYPCINFNMPKNKIAIDFIETLKFQNSYLKGIGGDYDGDQVTAKIIWSQEANDEIEKVMKSKSYIVTPSGTNIRVLGNECTQTLFTLTKNPNSKSKIISDIDKNKLLALKPRDITFDYLVSLFADTGSENDKIKKSKMNPNDILILNAKEYINNTKVETTVGRFIFNKLIIEGIHFEEITGYVNNEFTAKDYEKFEAILSDALIADKITVDQMIRYIDYRDWLGLELHSVITTSFTPAITKIPKEVKTLKKELLKKYEKELNEGDPKTAELIEKQLIEKTKEVLKDDVGLDLYASGARGSIDNNLKNIILMKGAVKNPITGKYDIVKSSLMDGMDKENIPSTANSIVLGAYPKAVGTADSGYLAKQLLAGMQTEVVDEDGTDCGTNRTLSVVLDSSNRKDLMHRNINDNGKVVLLEDKNIDKYMNKKLALYSPMFCTGDKICAKCAGLQINKSIGLQSSKVATTLTNLNMKKFHDNVIHYKPLDIDDLFIGDKGSDIVQSKGNEFVLKNKYCEFYIPLFYFQNSYKFAEDNGDTIKALGVFNVGIYKNGKLDHITTLNIPSWIDLFSYDYEMKDINLPGTGNTKCMVLKYYEGNKLFSNSLIVDSVNAQVFLKCITYGKLPKSIPYNESINMWIKNQKMNDVNFGVPSIILELILSVAYRDKDDMTHKFAKKLKDSSVNMYDYEMASIRQICQYASTFTAITFEDFDSMVTTSLNRVRKKQSEAESPVEMLLKL